MVAHAAAGSTFYAYDDDTHVVVLAADAEQLGKLAALLRAEQDLHEFHTYEVWETEGRYAGQLLAIGVEPGDRSTRKPYFEHLSLYGGSP